MHDPQVTAVSERYQARLRLAAQGQNQVDTLLGDLVVATDLGRVPLAHRPLLAHELGQDYCEVCLDFRVEKSCKLDLRVRRRRRLPAHGQRDPSSA